MAPGDWVMVGMANERVPKANGRRRKLVVIRYAKHRRFFLDMDNFIGGCKPLLDAAILKELTVDDSPEHVEVEYLQVVGEPRTVLGVEDRP